MLLFAYLVLSLYPIVGAYLIGTAPPHRVASRVSAVFFSGIMFLPQNLDFDLPAWPPVGKFELAPSVCLLGTLIAHRKKYSTKTFFSGASLFIWVSFFGWFMTTATNKDALFFGPTRLQGLSVIDAFYAGMTLLMTQGAAFFVARAMHRTPADLEDLLTVIVLVGLTQVPLCLYELRMSPQLHRIVYGYSTLNFFHVKRGDGFKPTAFTTGGLHMAIFLFTAASAAGILKKVKTTRLNGHITAAFFSIWGVLLVSRNVGSNVFALIALALVFFGSVALHRQLTWFVVGFVCLYPYLRSSGKLDVYGFTDWIARHSAERAHSLAFRFFNEDQMLARAMERPWFGWGGYGRNFIFKPSGTTDTIPDGAWIIAISMRGIVGLIGQWGMLILPLIGWARRMRQWSLREQRLVAGLIVTTVLCLLDLIPNGIFGPTTAYLAGAAAGVKDFKPNRAS